MKVPHTVQLGLLDAFVLNEHLENLKGKVTSSSAGFYGIQGDFLSLWRVWTFQIL
jgi:hypothetical protein